MNILKKITLFRFYLAICLAALSAFTYAEYYGYILTGSDETAREKNSAYYHGARVHHK